MLRSGISNKLKRGASEVEKLDEGKKVGEANKGREGAKPTPWKPNTPGVGSVIKVDLSSGVSSRMDEKKAREQKAQEEAAAAAMAAVGVGASLEAQRAAAEAAKKALKNIRETNKGAKLSEAPSLVRLVLEAERFKHNAHLHKEISFQHRVNERRNRLELGCGSKAERERMLSIHSAQRVESRKEVLRESIRTEMQMLEAIKKAGVKTFAGLADAWG